MSFDLPAGAVDLVNREQDIGQHEIALGPFDNGRLETRAVEGPLTRKSWRVPGFKGSAIELAAPLRAALQEAGYDILFDCAAERCGGFDFRFAIEVMDAPDMHVDLFDFHYVAATNPGTETLSLLVSRGQGAGYVQVITVYGGAGRRPSALAEDEAAQSDVVARLVQEGHAILGDLDFGSGSDQLGGGTFSSLDTLAAFLRFNSNAVVAIVGHTDSIGDLDENIALSKRRAEAVRKRLVDAYAIAGDRIAAEGMGYLSPVASNLTAEGRTANRRVEVILLGM
jgi:OOP family OmpA-OmpF porin